MVHSTQVLVRGLATHGHEGFTTRRDERKGVNETPRRGVLWWYISVLWTDSLFIVAEVDLDRRAHA